MGGYLKLFGFALLAVILWRIDIIAVTESFGDLRGAPVLGALLLALLGVVFKAVRWHLMLRRQGLFQPLWRSSSHYFAGIFTGIATPGRLGEFARVLYLKRDLGIGAGLGLSSIILDRLFDLYALLAAGAAAVWVMGLAGSLSWLFAGFALAALVMPALFLQPRIGRFFSSLMLRVVRRTALGRSLAGGTADFYDGIARLWGPGLLLDGLFTVAAYASIFSAAALLASSLGADLSPLQAGLLLGLANLVSLAPVTVAGIGTRDAVFVLAFAALGLPEPRALALSALVLAVFHLGVGVVGFCFFVADRPPPADSVAAQPSTKVEK